MTFDKVLQKYRKLSFSEYDKGNRFERLIQAYLLTDPTYCYRFKKVWLWNDFPGRNDLGGSDTGIDLVARTNEGDYWAIQCKCWDENATIDKAAVDSFLATSSRQFRNEDLRTVSFSNRLWISTTNYWGTNATEAIKNQFPPVNRLNLADLQNAHVDWEQLDKGISGDPARLSKRIIKPHQIEALEKTHDYFKSADRGKLIMACGTGKTFLALRIAEQETSRKGFILFLVPSISLLGQALREWTAYSQDPINPICVCSDPEVSRKKTKNEDIDTFSTVDLALPASTDVRHVVRQITSFTSNDKDRLTVVFSTYQSIDVISKAQKELKKNNPKSADFDLIICDEAHRTTGVALAGEEESAFTKVHNNEFISAKNRLYMTATPRLYSDDVKSRAAQADAVLCSMDDPQLYGEEIYRIGFGQAVEKDLLTDYKVLILTLSDKDVPPAIRQLLYNKDKEITIEDAPKLIGCINALSKQILGDEGVLKSSDPEPMRRAVAFCQTIAVSKKINSFFETTTSAYVNSLPTEKKEQMVAVCSQHIDGTMSAPLRDEKLSWLKGEGDPNECRVLTNVRCLSEGVDVPSLDAVMFLSARNSQVDVVQSVGRVMRKAPDKKYGYIIIPVVVPADVEPDKALNDNERYKVVWTVLNALRAHDDRFNATVNKIELNKKRPDNILVGRPDYTFDDDGRPTPLHEGSPGYHTSKQLSEQLALQFEQLQHVVFARMVQKVGSKRYWEQWAKNVAEIAERQVERIQQLIKVEGPHMEAFVSFLGGLQKNINPSINEREAIEMLSQHVITKPVFEALFEGYSFVKNNPISVSMQKMLDLLEGPAMEKDTQPLEKFYESVQTHVSGIKNAEGKQRVIIELYDKFFKTAFPKMVEKLGIVYTPVEVVDFIIHSVNDVLKKEFNRSLTDENIFILDPFVGTGTFITRLLQSGLIDKKDLPRKYGHEIWANEIVLLAYYIAAVNIENAYHDIAKESTYTPFDGICLTDTFQLGETDESANFFSEMFPQNSERVAIQKKAPIQVIVGNPPYSVGQRSANDNAQNLKYDRLDDRIAETYAEQSTATLRNSLYDSYIRAFRWSSDRLDKNGGVICFVSNGSWIDGNAQDGFRKCLEREFSSIYVFNLRGNQRTSGELSRREGGKIFGSGSRATIAITLLVKTPVSAGRKAAIHYMDVGDYLSREDKLVRIRTLHSMRNPTIEWKRLTPNAHGDWISLRSDQFSSYIELGHKHAETSHTFFGVFSNGLKTNRDAWCYNSGRSTLVRNINATIDFYNQQVDAFAGARRENAALEPEQFIRPDSTKLTWDFAQKLDLAKYRKYQFDAVSVRQSIYRPFFKQWVYFNRQLNNRVYQLPQMFPTAEAENLVICVSGVGVTKTFSTIITNWLPDLELIGKSQCFAMYRYEKVEKHNRSLFDEGSNSEYVRRDGITDFILDRAKKQYGKNVTKEDIFYYVYGFLHSPEYRKTFANDLKKMLPRLPLLEDVREFWAFSKAGRKLADLHVNYENVPPYDGVTVTGVESGFFKVEKMRFPKKGQKDTIIYNSRITIEHIPAKAYEYVVNGKSAIEWVMERYQITVHKESGIKNDPNDWADEVGNPRYILDLLLSIINVSMQTVDIVEGLPKLTFETSAGET